MLPRLKLRLGRMSPQPATCTASVKRRPMTLDQARALEFGSALIASIRSGLDWYDVQFVSVGAVEQAANINPHGRPAHESDDRGLTATVTPR